MKSTKRKLKNYRLLPYVTLILILLTILGVLNFNLLTYSMNRSKYEKTSIISVDESIDGVIALLPKLNIKYKYNNKEYTESKILYTDVLFKDTIKNLSSIYVNKESPSNFIIIPKFFSSYCNIGILCSIILCLVFFGINLRKGVKVRDERKKQEENNK